MTATALEPSTTTGDTNPDEINHLVCCDDSPTAICGHDVQAEGVVDDPRPEDECVVCTHMDETWDFGPQHHPNCPNYEE